MNKRHFSVVRKCLRPESGPLKPLITVFFKIALVNMLMEHSILMAILFSACLGTVYWWNRGIYRPGVNAFYPHMVH